MANKYKIMTIKGIHTAVKMLRDKERVPGPRPIYCHRTGGNYDRQKVRKETREILREIEGSFFSANLCVGGMIKKAQPPG